MNRRSFLKSSAGALAVAALGPQAVLAGHIGDRLAASNRPLGFRNGPQAPVLQAPLKKLQGTAPVDLAGRLYRNGPAQFTRGETSIGHWFDGDGLIRMFDINGDTATLTSRFVDTVKRRRDQNAGAIVMPGFGTLAGPDVPVTSTDDTNAANTSVMMVGEQLWALWEAGSPYGLNPEALSTDGPVTLRADLAQMPFSAHPKTDPDGTIWNFGSSFKGKSLFLWALSPSGKVKKTGLIKLPFAAYLHDWAVTKSKLIIPLQPWVFTTHRPPFVSGLEWQPERGMEVLVIDKDDFNQRKTYQLPAGAFFHTGNAFEDSDGTIRFDICLAQSPRLDTLGGREILEGAGTGRAEPKLAMATLRANGSADIEVTPHSAEFPQIDPRLKTQDHGKVFSVTEGASRPESGFPFTAVMGFDWGSGRVDIFDFGPDMLVEEPLFIPATGSPDSGWLIMTSLHLKAEATELHVFRSDRLADGPQVSWRTDYALPIGFHGIWV